MLAARQPQDRLGGQPAVAAVAQPRHELGTPRRRGPRADDRAVFPGHHLDLGAGSETEALTQLRGDRHLTFARDAHGKDATGVTRARAGLSGWATSDPARRLVRAAECRVSRRGSGKVDARRSRLAVLVATGPNPAAQPSRPRSVVTDMTALEQPTTRRRLLQAAAGAATGAVLARAPVAMAAPSLRGLARDLDGPLVVPGDAGFAAAAQVWNPAVGARPRAIAFCTSARDVARVVRFARDLGWRLSARSGRHSFEGYGNCSGIVADVSRLDRVRFDERERHRPGRRRRAHPRRVPRPRPGPSRSGAAGHLPDGRQWPGSRSAAGSAACCGAWA